ncbi:MAG: hypothetical protein ACI8XO_002453 [Verrucomicrobiales bacterium]|jgi:hypothetical protein
MKPDLVSTHPSNGGHLADWRAEMGCRGREAYRERFTFWRMNKNDYRLYRSIVERIPDAS